MKIYTELERVGTHNFREIINNLVGVVVLLQCILGKSKFVVIERERGNSFQRWIDWGDPSIETGARPGRSRET